jgi:hypothetical protein
VSDTCTDCGGKRDDCLVLCCDDCNTEECRWLRCAYHWRHRSGLSEVVSEEACRELAATIRQYVADVLVAGVIHHPKPPPR